MFPLIYLLFFYAFFALLGLLFLFFNIYHLAKFGIEHIKTYLLIGLYLILFFGTLGISFVFIASIDWSKEINLVELITHILRP